MPPKIEVINLSAAYNGVSALRDISLSIYEEEITGIMGPANSGKSTLMRILNRLIDTTPGVSLEGRVLLDGEDILAPKFDVNRLRTRVGMVFAKPIPLPRSIYENLTFGPRMHGVKDRRTLDERVESSLKAAILWDEIKDRLNESALKLSGGQQQRLCIARTLAMQSEVIMLDEPTSGLDPISTAKIEEAMRILKINHTVIIVSNNTKQIARISDKVAFLLLGELVEYGHPEQIFTMARNKRTEDYVSGRFG
ncbi:MAG: phosphate ABC transporter ATP-binding protein [Deltaproteobacteria bacterium]|nr:phosphate ABC transporter ATP-binding protein [Deltaproteobacteria bacterium]